MITSKDLFRCIILCVILAPSYLAAKNSSVDTIPVGVVGSEPFVVPFGKDLTGISVELWDRISAFENINYKFVRYDNITTAIEDVASGKIDALIGPISITKTRAEKVAFSQPYYRAGMGIAVRSIEPGTWEKLFPFIKTGFLILILSILPLLMLVGFLVWLAERNNNSTHFPRHPLYGIMNGMWFALVTMTTVGYGDKAPRTPVGRFISSIWMLVAVILMSSITAAVTASLTLSGMPTTDITGPLDLQKRSVAIIAGSTGVEAAKEYHAKPVFASDLKEAFEKLISREADAVMFDRTMLKYYLHQNTMLEAHVIESEFEQQNYGMAFPYTNLDLAHKTNIVLLGMLERDELAPLIRQWTSTK